MVAPYTLGRNRDFGHKWRMNMESFENTLARLETESGHRATIYQRNIYAAIVDACTKIVHYIINAVAGSGKTTTLLDALSFIPKSFRVLMVAFNKHIADELSKRIDIQGHSHASAQTLHSVGFGVFKKSYRHPKVDSNKVRYIVADVMGGYDRMNDDQKKVYYEVAAAVCKIISLFKNFGYGAIRPLADREETYKLATRYDVELPADIEQFFH